MLPVQLSFFDSSDAYWRLIGSNYDDLFYVHDACGFRFPFAGYGYRVRSVCPRCGIPMISFYKENE